ncbi:MAG TPA: hypothetical protein VGE52_03335, partial [Pirellulales bacterium]
MTHSLYSEENKRRGEPDARRLIAEFPTREAALLAARLRLDEDLQELYRDGISAEELVRLWTLFGDEPSLAPDDATAPFSAIDYVRSRAADLTENRGRLHAGSPNADEASDEAGDEPDD